MMLSGIYQISNTVTGDSYIGSSRHVESRVYQHIADLSGNRHGNLHLQRAWDKYGENSFEFAVLITCHIDLLTWYEQQFLDQWHPEYNINPSASRVTYTEDVLEKMAAAARKALTGRRKTALHRLHISENHVGMTGHQHSDETKCKISENNVRYWEGKTRSNDDRLKMSNGHVKDMSGSNNPFYGKKHSEETKRKMSIAAKRRHGNG